MKPYYDHDGIIIYNADARHVLPHLPAAETLITDPTWPNATAEIFGRDNPLEMFTAMWAALTETPTRAAVQLGCDTDPRFLSAVPAALTFFRVAWLERVRMRYKGRTGITGDVGYLFGKPPPSREGQHIIPGRITDASHHNAKNAHPCPRSIAHVKWLVKWWSAETDTILDPFMGSGTTLKAAKDAGRKAVGIEIDERYCEIAAARLAQTTMPLTEGPNNHGPQAPLSPCGRGAGGEGPDMQTAPRIGRALLAALSQVSA
jgi:site-specific DNA-methyltransferase (adenine-specific)